MARNGLEVEGDAGEEAERPFRADQHMGHVVAAVVARTNRVDVVAADPAQQGREALPDLAALALGQGAHPLGQLDVARLALERLDVARHLGEAEALAAREHGVDGAHVVHHVAVADRARAATVVARHAADRGAVRGRDVDRKEQPVRREPAVEPVEHDAGLDRHRARLGVEVEDVIEVLAHVDDQRLAHRLAALRRARPARQHGHALLAGDLHGADDVLLAFRHHHADRLDLVDRGVGRVAPAAEGVEQHLALELAAEPRGERAVAGPRAGVFRGGCGEAHGTNVSATGVSRAPMITFPSQNSA